MTYEKTWTFGSIVGQITNVPLKVEQDTLLNIKTILLATGKWVIYGCCGRNNGGTLTAPSSLPDTTDRWQVYSDIACSGNKNLQVPQSWCILYNDTLKLYYIISIAGDVYLSSILCFTQNTPTLASTSTWFPVVSNNIMWIGNPLLSRIENGKYTTHYTCTSEGHFIIWNTCDSTYIPYSQLNLIMLLPITTSKTSDITPWVCVFHNTTSEVLYVLESTAGPVKCFAPILSPNQPVDSFFLHYRGNINPIDDFITDSADGYINMLPILVYTTTPGFKSFKGIVQDVYWAPSGLVSGDTTPSTGQIEYMKIGQLMIPANTALVK